MRPGADVESFGVQAELAIWGSLGWRWGEAAQNMLARRTLTDPGPRHHVKKSRPPSTKTWTKPDLINVGNV